MNSFKEDFTRIFRNPIILAFTISIFYWIYLVFASRMIIVFDAVNYESLGKMLARQGWVEFFKTGPNREPLYPALVSISMRLGGFFGVSYQLVQVIIQLAILLLTQILTLRIMRILKINDLLSALTILYLGISPATVNSSLSLFSEIVTYPLILAGLILVYISWLSFKGPRLKIILLAVATSLSFTLIALSKGIFELVIPIFFFLFLVSILFTRNRKFIANALVYIAVVLGIFYSLLGGYKSLNEVFNGHFTITNRGGWVLYGSTARRMEPLTAERFLTALAYVPGENVCQSVFGEKKCSSWVFWRIDELGSQKVRELGDIPPEAVDRALIGLSKQEILKNPAQYALFFAVEASKMFFWESTQIGYVVYPEGLTKLFNWAPFKNGLRLAMAFLTGFAVIYLFILLWRKRETFFELESSFALTYFCLLFIFSFVSLYSAFVIITRYLLPIVPLYLILIAYVLQKVFFFRFK